MNTTTEAMNTTTESITCTDCGTIFSWENKNQYFAGALRPKACPACEAIREAAAEEFRRKREADELAKRIEDAKAASLAAIDKQTLARFKETDQRHRDFNLVLARKAARWSPTPEAYWLALIGPTGACKTRVGILVLRRIVESAAAAAARRQSVMIASAYEITAAIRNQHSNRMVYAGVVHDDRYQPEGQIARDFLEEARNCDFLLLDDLGKSTKTPATVAGLFELIDHRYARNKVMIWTANSDIAGICRDMPAEIGEPLGGRLLELSAIIQA